VDPKDTPTTIAEADTHVTLHVVCCAVLVCIRRLTDNQAASQVKQAVLNIYC